MKPKSLFMIIVVILFFIIGFFIYYNGKDKKLNRTLDKVVFTEINNLKQGDFSKVKGKVITVKNPLIAPLSKKECVYYSFKIQEKKKTGKNDRWNTIHFEEQVQHFLVKNNKDSLLIKPSTENKNFETYIKVDKTVSNFTKKNSSKKIDAFLEEYKTKATPNIGFGINIRAIESIIEENDIITVAGTVNYNKIKEPIKGGSSFSEIIALDSNLTQKLIITDFPLIDSTN